MRTSRFPLIGSFPSPQVALTQQPLSETDQPQFELVQVDDEAHVSLCLKQMLSCDFLVKM